jgi:hypothetical protein
MVKPKYSFKDRDGLLWIACSECERGGNGSDKDKCSCGWQITRSGKQGCFMGRLLVKFDESEVKLWKEKCFGKE